MGGLVRFNNIREKRMYTLLLWRSNELKAFLKYDVGGTWLENQYLNVRCDQPSHVYCFAFEPNPGLSMRYFALMQLYSNSIDWSSFYSPGAEIEEYIRKTTKKWNLDKHIKFNHKLVSAIWDESAATWKLELEYTQEDGTESGVTQIVHDQCDVLINASGILKYGPYPFL